MAAHGMSMNKHTQIRPILSYASSCWDPHTQQQTWKIEMVQRRAARFVMGDYHPRHSVTQMLQTLQWHTLNEGRARAKVIMMYRILHGLIAIPPAPPYIHPTSHTRTSRRNTQFQQLHCRMNVYLHSFFPSVISLWQVLPASTRAAPTLDHFKGELEGIQLRPE